MPTLETFTYILLDITLAAYLSQKVYAFLISCYKRKRLVNNHPEMKGVDPVEESMFVFESDESLKYFVLSNDEPGADEPFYVSEEDIDI